MFGIEMAMVNAIHAILQAEADRKEWQMIMDSPVDMQGRLIASLNAKKEKERLERRERDMHDQLCESIEKAGDNARPRGWEF
jgi:uncharacterized NAD(P)/FAD-binding protein YdhS